MSQNRHFPTTVSTGNVIKQWVHAFSCAYIEVLLCIIPTLITPSAGNERVTYRPGFLGKINGPLQRSVKHPLG